MNRTQIVWSVFIVIFCVVYYMGQKENSYLLDNKMFTTGKVTKIDYKGSYKGINFVYFIYMIGNDTFESRFSTQKYMPRSADTMIGLRFPIIYNSQNSKQLRALLYQWQFEELNMHQPDSLKWVNKYFRE